MKYLEFNGEDVTPWQAQGALDAVAHLRRGVHTIHRHMRLKPEIISGLQAGASLGLYWSEVEDVPRDNLMDDPSSGDWVVLTAKVPTKSINVVETAGARLLNQIEKGWKDESEVRLKRNAPLTLIAIQDDAGRSLRPDLSGQQFVA